MSNKLQIVPDLAEAVHGVTEEVPLIHETSSPESIRSRLASTTSSSSSYNFHVPLSSKNSRPISQIDARKAFSYFDKNHDGKLSIKEFKSVMHDLGYKTVDKRFIRQIFAEANRNDKKQTLTYAEFAEFLEPKLSSPTTSAEDIDIETLFNCYDLDRNGYIEPKELRKVMKRLTGEKLSKRDIEEMINTADRNGDGLLDKTEFALLCSAF